MSTTNPSSSASLAPVLTPVLDERFAARWPHVVMTGWFAVLFVFLNYIPLDSANTWTHVIDGQTIRAKGASNEAVARFPLLEGMSHPQVGWLSPLGFAVVADHGGAALLSTVGAVLKFCAFGILGLAFYRITERKRLVLAGLSFSLFLGMHQIPSVDPWIFGLMGTSLLLFALSGRNAWRPYQADRLPVRGSFIFQVFITALFGLWVNLSSTFVLGLGILVAVLCGEMIDHVRHHSARTLLLNRRVREFLIATELALAATLLQPQGWTLWSDVLQGRLGLLGSASDLRSPLLLQTWIGLGFATFWATALLVLRASHRILRSAEILLLVGSSAILAGNVRLAVVLAPVLYLSLIRHASAILPSTDRNRRKSCSENVDHRPVRFGLSLICLLLIWTSFSLSPISQPILGGKPRSDAQVYGSSVPLALPEVLEAIPSDGLTWAPSYWSAWLEWKLGNHGSLFSDSRLSRFPESVRRDYASVFRGNSQWERVLDRYGVETLVTDKHQQKDLIKKALNGTSSWRRVYEDAGTIVFRRKVADRFADAADLGSKGGI